MSAQVIPLPQPQPRWSEEEYSRNYSRLCGATDLTWAEIDALCAVLATSPHPWHRFAATHCLKAMGEAAAAEVNADARAEVKAEAAALEAAAQRTGRILILAGIVALAAGALAAEVQDRISAAAAAAVWGAGL